MGRKSGRLPAPAKREKEERHVYISVTGQIQRAGFGQEAFHRLHRGLFSGLLHLSFRVTWGGNRLPGPCGHALGDVLLADRVRQISGTV